MPSRDVKVKAEFRLSIVAEEPISIRGKTFAEQKNGGHLKRGGLSNARLFVAAVRVRYGRKPVSWEEQTNRPGARAVRTYLLRRFNSVIIQTKKFSFAGTRSRTTVNPGGYEKSNGI